MDSLVDDNFSEIRKTFTDPLYNAMGLHVDMGASFHDCGTRDDYGIGCCATLDGVTHYAKAWPIEDHDSRWGACMGSYLLVVAFGSRISNAFRCNADSGGQGCRHVG